MRKWLRGKLNAIIVILSVAVFLVIIFMSGDLNGIVNDLSTLKFSWVLAAIACAALYLLARAISVKYYLTRQGYRFRLCDALLVTGVGQFYSAVTPMATGGQPMQVYYMTRKGIPVSAATAVVSVKFLAFQFSLILLSIVGLICNFNAVNDALGPLKAFLVLGYILSLALPAALLLMSVNQTLLNKISGGIIALLKKMRLLKDPGAALKNLRGTLGEYRDSLMTLRSKPRVAVILICLSTLQVLFFGGIVVCLYRAFGLSGTSDFQLFTLQLSLLIMASFIPLPGASGAQEGGFYLMLLSAFSENLIMPAIIVWRFFTYYLLMLLGLAAVSADAVREAVIKRRKRKLGKD